MIDFLVGCAVLSFYLTIGGFIIYAIIALLTIAVMGLVGLFSFLYNKFSNKVLEV